MAYIPAAENTADNRLSVSAYYLTDGGAPSHLEVYGLAADRAAAEAFVARFPKAAKLRGVAFHGEVQGWVSVNINLAPNGSNGGRNETGIRRYRTIQRAAAKLGVALVWHGDDIRTINAYRTADEFEAAIA
jgi:hypothetical protein